MHIAAHLQKVSLMTVLVTMVTVNLVQAAPVLVSVTDPVGDNTGPVDVTGMDFEFDNAAKVLENILDKLSPQRH